MYVNNDFATVDSNIPEDIPSSSSAMFRSVPGDRDTLWVSPNDWGYSQGTWLVTIEGLENPRSEISRYKLRWFTVAPEECKTPPPAIVTPNPDPRFDRWTLLEENIPVSFLGLYSDPPRMRFYKDGVSCSDFAITVKIREFFDYRQALLHLSMLPPVSTVHTNIGLNQFSAAAANYNTIVLRNICTPNNEAPFVVYAELANFTPNQVIFTVTAISEATTTFLMRPVASNPPDNLLRAVMGYPQLICGDEVSGYDKYQNMYIDTNLGNAVLNQIDPVSVTRPANYFYPIVSTDSTEQYNHFFPPNKFLLPTSFIRTLPWQLLGDSWINYAVNPRRLTYAFLMQRTDSETYHQFLHSDLDSCQIIFHALTNEAGEQAETATTIVEKVLPPCNATLLSAAKARISFLIDEMKKTADYDSLRMFHVQVQSVLMGDAYQSCKQQLESYFEESSVNYQFSGKNGAGVTPCLSKYESDEWKADPCCHVSSVVHDCCIPTPMIEESRPVVGAPIQENVADCLVSECASKTLATHANQAQLAADQDNGCTAQWEKIAQESVIAETYAFIHECRIELLGVDRENKGTQGVRCTTDTDCPGSTCDITRRRCAYTESDVVDCWVERMDDEIAALLYNHWLISDAVTPERMRTEILSRYNPQQCSGFNEIAARKHLYFSRASKGCTDACYDPALGIDNEPRCYNNDPAFCEVDSDCSTVASDFCLRVWYNPEAADTCGDEMRCNVAVNADGSETCPYQASDVDCETNCQAGTSSCIVCEGDFCTDTGVSESECASPLCFHDGIYEAGLTEAECAEYGSCSLPFYGDTTKDACESHSFCSGFEGLDQLNAFDTFAEGYGISANNTGVCFTPFFIDVIGGAVCDLNYQGYFPHTRFGCACLNQFSGSTANPPQTMPNPLQFLFPPNANCDASITEADCTANGWRWVDRKHFTMTGDQCQDNTDLVCAAVNAGTQEGYYEDPGYGLVEMDLAKCQQCGNTVRPITVNVPQQWIPASVVQGTWVQRTYEPALVLEEALDYNNFQIDVNSAIISAVSFAYATETVCSYESALNAMEALQCDCNSMRTDTNCYALGENTGEVALLITRVCPYIAKTLELGQGTLEVQSTTMEPANFCLRMEVFLVPASTYEQADGSGISSEIFLERPPNSFSVLQNEKGAVVGQIITSGIRVSFVKTTELADSMYLCINENDAIPQDDEFYPNYAFGHIAFGAKKVTYYSAAIPGPNNTVCADIFETGTYFGALSVGSPQDKERVSESSRAQGVVASVFYFIIFLLACWQVFRVWKQTQKLKERSSAANREGIKYFTLFIVIVYALERGIYFALPPEVYSGNTTGHQVLALLLFELPTLLFLIMYTSILYLWIEVIYKVKQMKRSVAVKQVFNIYVGVNIALVVIFFLFVIIFFTITEETALPCQQFEIKPPAENKAAVNLVYLVFIAAISVILALMYIIIGSYYLIGPLAAKKGSPKYAYFVRMTVIIIITFGLLFIIRSILIIFSASSGLAVPLIVFALLEIFPSLALLYYVVPPPQDNKLLSTLTKSRATMSTRSMAGSGRSMAGSTATGSMNSSKNSISTSVSGTMVDSASM
eukprot:TRINITY_DN3611_c0_g3_i1.p1 TRINITY_DN3611_c0_g3~~TRINITY_DN3611_c0_g3_i1.p1  ORF type:complete len:1587 (-),score=355.48 TRINITY_DN3611_c0_g3_i1:210-4970(-)